jgi:hypothetical protein
VSSFGKTGTLELLSSVVALCLHEVANAQNSFAAPNNHFLQAVAPKNGNGHTWLRHIDGLEQLFTVRRPMSNGSGQLDTALLQVSRPMMIVAALYARRPSLMARPKWSATLVCRSSDDNQPSPCSVPANLLDALPQIPKLYSQYNVIVSG